MSEDLVKQLSSYKAQLQQVEVALSTDQENEDLLKLQKDLQVCLFQLNTEHQAVKVQLDFQWNANFYINKNKLLDFES